MLHSTINKIIVIIGTKRASWGNTGIGRYSIHQKGYSKGLPMKLLVIYSKECETTRKSVEGGYRTVLLRQDTPLEFPF